MQSSDKPSQENESVEAVEIPSTSQTMLRPENRDNDETEYESPDQIIERNIHSTDAEHCQSIAAPPETVSVDSAEIETDQQTEQQTEQQPEQQTEQQPTEQQTETDSKPREGLLRWNYLIPRAIVVALVWGFFTFGFDPLLRRGIVLSSQTIVGAQVDVDDISTSLFSLKVKVDGVQVTNRAKPTRNLIEFDRFEGELDTDALLKKSYVINHGRLTNIQWDTQRTSSGQLKSSTDTDDSASDFSIKEKFTELGKELTGGLLGRAKHELDPQQLESVRLADQFKDDWHSDFKSLETRARLVDAKVKGLRKDIKNRKGNTLKQIEQYTKVAENVSRLLKDVDGIRRDLEQLPNQARSDLTDLDAAKERDFVRIRKKLDRLLLDPEGITKFLLGPEMVNRTKTALDWMNWTRERYSTFTSAPKPERSRGQEFLFPREHQLPLFLIRELEVTGSGQIAGDLIEFQGLITGITSNAAIYGKPIEIHITGKGRGNVTIDGTIDSTTEIATNDISMTYSIAQPKPLELGSDNQLQISVASESLRWQSQIRTTGNRLAGTVLLQQDGVAIRGQPGGKIDKRIAPILDGVLAGIDKINATAVISGTIKDPKWTIRSNLGPIIARGMNDALDHQIRLQRQKLVAHTNSAVQSKTKELTSLFNERYSGLLGKLKADHSQITELIPRVSGRPFDLRKLLR